MTIDLATYLIEQGQVGPADMDDALQQQVIFGGALDTNLLELGLLDEAAVTEALAVVHHLPPATPELLQQRDPRMPKLFPPRLAQKYGVVPVSMTGRSVMVLAAGRVHPLVVEEIGFMLSLGVRSFVVCEFRLKLLLRDWMGMEIEPRFEALADKLERPAQARVIAQVAAEPVEETGTPSAPLAPPVDRELVERALEDAEAAERRKREAVRQGPLSLAAANEACLRADSRAALVDVVLRFSRQFMAYVGLFVVQEDAILGWDAVGAPDAADRIRRVRLSLSSPSVLRTVVQTRAYYLGPVPVSGLNDELLQVLGRERPRNVLIIPITVQDRLVGLLFGDAGLGSVKGRRVVELLVFVSRLSQAFEALIRRQKVRRSEPESTEAAQPVLGLMELAAREERESQALPAAEVSPAVAEPAAPETPIRLGEPVIVEEPTRVEELAESIPEPEWQVTPASPVPEPAPQETRVRVEDLEAFGTGEDAVAVVDVDEGLVVVDTPDGFAPVVPFDRQAPVVPVLGSRAATAEPTPVTAELRATEVLATPAPEVEDVTPVELIELGSEELQHLRPGDGGTPTPVAESAATAPEQLAELTEQLAGRDRAAAALARERLCAIGPSALKVVMTRFPGHLLFDVRGAHDRIPPLAEHGELLAYLVEMGAEACEIIAERLTDPNPTARYYAVKLLGEVRFHRAVPQLAGRLTDRDALVRLTTIDVLQTYHHTPGFRAMLQNLRNRLRSTEPDQQAIAAALLGNFRDTEALPLLIELVCHSQKMVARAAQESLAYITKQDFGTSERKWIKWWKTHKGQNRLQWLIAGLASKNRDIRFSSARELNQLTHEFFGYYFDSDKADREAAIRRWERWWEDKGRRLRFDT